MTTLRPQCIVCKRLIGTETVTYWVATNSSAEKRAHMERQTGGRVRVVDASPKTREECQALVEMPVVSIRHGHNGVVSRFSTWDGKSYKDKFFCSAICAARQGYASAQAGRRYSWD